MDQVTPETPPSVREAGERVKEDLSLLGRAAERRREELIGQVRELVDQHPIAAVGVAFGTGYVLSGALLSRATARVVALGARFYLGRVLRETAFESLLQALGMGREPMGPEGP